MAVFRALLYFNLPENIVFKPVRPKKVFTMQQDSYHDTLDNLVDALSSGSDGGGDRYGGRMKVPPSPNLILMLVEPVNRLANDGHSTILIGGYASHCWTGGSGGDKSCFLFNLTQNLRFQARSNATAPLTSTKVDNT